MGNSWWTMSICNELRPFRAWLVALGGVACFDVQQVELPSRPERLEIDDFEAADDTPRASTFLPWSCSVWPEPSRVSCARGDSDLAGGRAEVVDFELRDTSDGTMDSPGLLFESHARLGDMNFTDYSAFSFRALLELGPEDAPRAPPLLVRFRCDGARISGESSNGSWLETEVVLGPAWADFQVPIETLLRPNYLLSFPRRDCLAHVGSLELVLQSRYPDGQDLVGTLTLDDLALE